MTSPHTITMPKLVEQKIANHHHNDCTVLDFDVDHTIQLPIDSQSSSEKESARYLRLGDLDGGLNPEADPKVTMNFWFPLRTQRPQRHGRRRRQVPVIEAESSSEHDGDMYTIELRQIGLLVNFLLLGYLDGVLPVITEALYLPDSVHARRILNATQIALLLRVVFAILSDSVFHASEFRRRGLMMVGWIVILTLSAVLTGLAWPSTATSTGAYAVFLMLLPLGQTLVGVSADGLMLEYAHREDLYSRGCVQMLLFATRKVGELIGRNTVSSGKQPAADSECSAAIDCIISPAIVFALVALFSVLGLVSTIFVTKAPTRSTTLSLDGSTIKEKMQATYKFHARKVYVSLLVIGFVQAASFAWSSPTAKDIASEWLSLSSTTLWVSDSFNRSIQVGAALLMLFAWRNTSWRALIFISITIASLGAEVPSNVLILLKTTRSAPVFLVAHHIAQLGKCVANLVVLLIAAEVAMPHKEIKVRGAPNLIIPVVLLIIVGCLFVAAITSAMLSMFESTMCLKFAGGTGCEDKTGE